MARPRLPPGFLAVTLGAGPAILGIIEGIAEATASLLKLCPGAWSARLGKKKPLVVGGYLLSSVARPLMGLAAGWGHVLAVRFSDRIGKGIRSSPRAALIAASVPADDRGRAFGLQRAMDHLGAVLGPGVAFLLLAGAGISYRSVFFLAAVPGAAAVVALLFLVRDPGTPPPPHAGGFLHDGGLRPGFRRSLGGVPCRQVVPLHVCGDPLRPLEQEALDHGEVDRVRDVLCGVGDRGGTGVDGGAFPRLRALLGGHRGGGAGVRRRLCPAWKAGDRLRLVPPGRRAFRPAGTRPVRCPLDPVRCAGRLRGERGARGYRVRPAAFPQPPQRTCGERPGASITRSTKGRRLPGTSPNRRSENVRILRSPSRDVCTTGNRANHRDVRTSGMSFTSRPSATS